MGLSPVILGVGIAGGRARGLFLQRSVTHHAWGQCVERIPQGEVCTTASFVLSLKTGLSEWSDGLRRGTVV